MIESDGRILVSLRKPKHGRPSQWEFPGGKVEAGENEREALVRELREELGVKAHAGEFLRRVVFRYPEIDVDIAFYAGVIEDGEPQPLVMAELRWVARHDLAEMDFLEADRTFVAELVRGAARD